MRADKDNAEYSLDEADYYLQNEHLFATLSLAHATLVIAVDLHRLVELLEKKSQVEKEEKDSLKSPLRSTEQKGSSRAASPFIG
jgi:hypothetical protein